MQQNLWYYIEDLTKLVQVWGIDNDTAIECLPPMTTAAVVIAKYMNGMFQVKKMKEVCNMIKSDSKRLMDFPEHEVLQMHAMEGRKLVIYFVGALAILLLIYLILPTVLILNDIITKNATEEKYLMYQGDYYFVDVQRYYYIATVHCYISSIVIIALILPLDAMYIIFIQHACTIFAITGHRLKTMHIFNTKECKDFDEHKYKNPFIDEQEEMYKRLILCVKEYQRALECSQMVQSAFSMALFFQIFFNILCLSITGVQALLKLSSGSITDVLRLTIWMMGQLIHLLFMHLPGQRLSNFSEQVYFDAVECMWHTFFIKSRVVYQFLVMNTLSPYKSTALKVVTLNMETFLSVTQAAVSYFTVLSSTL